VWNKKSDTSSILVDSSKFDLAVGLEERCGE
jgi:hypothetical protein